jgi:hypothetical protein
MRSDLIAPRPTSRQKADWRRKARRRPFCRRMTEAENMLGRLKYIDGGFSVL